MTPLIGKLDNSNNLSNVKVPEVKENLFYQSKIIFLDYAVGLKFFLGSCGYFFFLQPTF
jgi:hypothetical protein